MNAEETLATELLKESLKLVGLVERPSTNQLDTASDNNTLYVQYFVGAKVQYCKIILHVASFLSQYLATS
jgi:hypothetical protein